MTLDELEEVVNRMRKMGCITFNGITIQLQAPMGYVYEPKKPPAPLLKGK